MNIDLFIETIYNMEKLSGKDFPAAVLKEVNDNMAMEELQQVQELEKELAAQYAAAQADAKRRIAVEQRAAAREIEDSCRNADVEARQLMAEAEQRAGEETEKILAKARTECEKMQSAARANLERAAQWIAEEVVNDKWQS